MTQRELFQSMQADVVPHGANLQTTPWQAEDICNAARTILEAGKHSSLALRNVARGQAPSTGHTLPHSRTDLPHLLDALPKTSKEVHELDESSTDEKKWKAVAGLVNHYRGQLRVVDGGKWKLMNINSRGESANNLLHKLHPFFMLKRAQSW